MSKLSRLDHERLDRLAGSGEKGGGLPLPSFFSSVVNELLDNGPSTIDRLTEIVSRVDPTKKTRLNESWNGDWAFLASDIMEQLSWADLVIHDGEKWELAPKFIPGVRTEVIPARKGLSRSTSFLAWAAEERARLNEAARVDNQMDQALRQPRGKVHSEKIINEIRSSYEVNGARSPVLYAMIDGEKVIIDGRHRLSIDPEWIAVELPNVTTKEQALNAILELDDYHKKRYELLSDKAADDLRKLLGDASKMPTQNERKRARVEAELRSDATRSNRAIAEISRASDMLVADVRKSLQDSCELHVLIIPSGPRPTARHSTACWCGEGDAEARPEQKPKKEAVSLDPKLQELIHDAIVNSPETTNKELSELAKAHGIKANPQTTGTARLIAKDRISRDKERPIIIDESCCNHCCPVHCPE